MVAKKTSLNSDRIRLAGIKSLFIAAETKKMANAFGATEGGPDVTGFDEILTFANVTNGVEAALTGAIQAFSHYPQEPPDGDVHGAAAELLADVRALTNVALGLSPPSRTFYNQVLGGLVQLEKVAGPPPEAGDVPFPPLRVSVGEIERRRQFDGTTNDPERPHTGHGDDFTHGFMNPAVVGILIRLQNQIVSTYLDKIAGGPAKVVAAVTPLVHKAWEELDSQVPAGIPAATLATLKANLEKLHPSQPHHQKQLYPTEVTLAPIEEHFMGIYSGLTT